MWLHGISINIYSQVAIVMRIGLAAKNGVLIVEIRQSASGEGKLTLPDTRAAE